MEFRWKDIKTYLEGNELLQLRRKRAVIHIFRKALRVLFGSVTDAEIKIIREKLEVVEKDQRILAQLAQDIISIQMLTRLELMESRITFKLFNKRYGKNEKKVFNTLRPWRLTCKGENIFVKLHIPIMTIRNKLRQTIQSIMVLLEHVRP